MTTKLRTADYYNAGRLPTIFEVFEQLHPGKDMNVKLYEIKRYDEFRQHFYCIPRGECCVYMKRVYDLYVATINSKDHANKTIL